MKRVQGAQGFASVECINPQTGEWVARWAGESNEGKTSEDGEPLIGVSYMEDNFDHEPTWDEVAGRVTEARKIQYELRSDGIYISMQKYLARSQEEKAQQAKADWLAELQAIEAEYPKP
ncbi:hypothetical protein EZS27_016905 [termite gut metagenome]|uniref:Uncharacterized protein n=1 Tax=termite gut metagenome TaxID=433724 RepID=A0A5J4RMD3_9ZZZZ